MSEYRSRHAEPTGPDEPGPADTPDPDPDLDPRTASRARAVETVVIPERGQWAVDIVVVFDDGVVRRRIQTYRTEALARISAKYIRRGAERDIGGGPVHG